jgi:thymidylate kinase
VRDAYNTLAAQEPDRIRLVDGRASVEDVAAEIWNIVSRYV